MKTDSNNNLAKDTEDSAAMMLVSISNVEINNIKDRLEKLSQFELVSKLNIAIDLMYEVSKEIEKRGIDFGDFL